MIVPLNFAPQACQGVVHVITPTDGTVLIVGVNESPVNFELDNNGSVFPGRILVPIGGSPVACASNLAAAINTQWGDSLRAHTEGAFIDIIAHHPGVNFAMATVGTGIVSEMTQQPQRAIPTTVVMVKRDVNSTDVTRGKIVVLVRLDYIEQVQVKFIGTNTWGYTLDWTGSVWVYPGRIELFNAGSIPYTVGYWCQLIAIGDRYEQ